MPLNNACFGDLCQTAAGGDIEGAFQHIKGMGPLGHPDKPCRNPVGLLEDPVMKSSLSTLD